MRSSQTNQSPSYQHQPTRPGSSPTTSHSPSTSQHVYTFGEGVTFHPSAAPRTSLSAVPTQSGPSATHLPSDHRVVYPQAQETEQMQASYSGYDQTYAPYEHSGQTHSYSEHTLSSVRLSPVSPQSAHYAQQQPAAYSVPSAAMYPFEPSAYPGPPPSYGQWSHHYAQSAPSLPHAMSPVQGDVTTVHRQLSTPTFPTSVTARSQPHVSSSSLSPTDTVEGKQRALQDDKDPAFDLYRSYRSLMSTVQQDVSDAAQRQMQVERLRSAYKTAQVGLRHLTKKIEVTPRPPSSPGQSPEPSAKKAKVDSASGDPPVCQGCGATSTPEWRRGPLGPRSLCNACGLVYAKMVKRRNRQAAERRAQGAASGSRRQVGDPAHGDSPDGDGSDDESSFSDDAVGVADLQRALAQEGRGAQPPARGI